MTDPAILADVDQEAAKTRDWYIRLLVDVHDPVAAWAIRASWALIAEAYIQGNERYFATVLAAVGQTVENATPPTRAPRPSTSPHPTLTPPNPGSPTPSPRPRD